MAEPRELFPIVMGRGKSPVVINAAGMALQAELETVPEPEPQELALIEQEQEQGKVKSTGTPAKN